MITLKFEVLKKPGPNDLLDLPYSTDTTIGTIKDYMLQKYSGMGTAVNLIYNSKQMTDDTEKISQTELVSNPGLIKVFLKK